MTTEKRAFWASWNGLKMSWNCPEIL